MFFPLIGMLIVSLILTPFAAVYWLTVRESRNLASVGLFFVGSGLWLITIGALFELLELLGYSRPSGLAWLSALAPL